jgi:nucleotide-binding universal stress UspA family protein
MSRSIGRLAPAAGVARIVSAERVVVTGVDGSPAAEWALQWAADEAARRHAVLRWALDEAPSLGSPVRAMFCWQYPPVGSFLPGPAEGYRARAEEVVARATAKAAAWRPDVGCSVEERFGDPADVLLEAAATASLLVLGSRPPHDLHDLLGSVPEQCSRASACPLLVVRGRAG